MPVKVGLGEYRRGKAFTETSHTRDSDRRYFAGFALEVGRVVSHADARFINKSRRKGMSPIDGCIISPVWNRKAPRRAYVVASGSLFDWDIVAVKAVSGKILIEPDRSLVSIVGR